MTLKYDIKLDSNNLNHDLVFLDFLERFINNKRRNKIGKRIVGYHWSIDIDLSGYLHMHLFLHVKFDLNKDYNKTKYLFKKNVEDMNNYILKLIRTDKNELLLNSRVNMVNENWDMIDYISSEHDILSRNRNRIWLSYNGHMDTNTRMSLDIRWYGSSHITTDDNLIED